MDFEILVYLLSMPPYHSKRLPLYARESSHNLTKRGDPNECFNGEIMLVNEMHKPFQVICTSSKIKEGCLENVRDWLKHLQDRKEETLESFRSEGVWLESAFLQEQNGQYYLIYYMRAEDVDQAMAVFRSSSLEIDLFHQQCWERFTEQHQILSPVFHLENPYWEENK